MARESGTDPGITDLMEKWITDASPLICLGKAGYDCRMKLLCHKPSPRKLKQDLPVNLQKKFLQEGKIRVALKREIGEDW